MLARSLRSLARFGYRCTNEIHQNESSLMSPPDLLSPISVVAHVLSVYCARLTGILVFYHFHRLHRKSVWSCLLCRKGPDGKYWKGFRGCNGWRKRQMPSGIADIRKTKHAPHQPSITQSSQKHLGALPTSSTSKVPKNLRRNTILTLIPFSTQQQIQSGRTYPTTTVRLH